MPDLYRGTFIMEGMSQGWSESYIFPRDGFTIAQVNQEIMDPLATLRASLLAREYKLTAWRATRIRLADGTAVKRQSDLVISSRGPGGTTAAWAGCQPRECVIVNGITANGEREKKIYMRGIPDVVIEDGGELNTAENIGWFSRLNSFTAILLRWQAGFLIDQTVGQTYLVNNYIINPNLTQQFTFSGNIFDGLPLNSRVRVRLSKVNGQSRLNGIQTLEVASPVSGSTISPLAVGEYVSGGEGVRLVDPKPFVSVTFWAPEIARTHQTGKVSVGSRGRRSAIPRV